MQGRAGDPAEIAAAMDKITDKPRGDPADQEPHRRLDLQESAGQQVVAADRQGRHARLCRWAGEGLGAALQFPDQRRRRHGRADRGTRRNRAGPRARTVPASISTGRSSASACKREGCAHERSAIPQDTTVAVLMGGWSAERAGQPVVGRGLCRRPATRRLQGRRRSM